jgi:hypothetical protein
VQGESNCGKRKIKRIGQARRQICEIAGQCGEINLATDETRIERRFLKTNPIKFNAETQRRREKNSGKG